MVYRYLTSTVSCVKDDGGDNPFLVSFMHLWPMNLSYPETG